MIIGKKLGGGGANSSCTTEHCVFVYHTWHTWHHLCMLALAACYLAIATVPRSDDYYPADVAMRITPAPTPATYDHQLVDHTTQIVKYWQQRFQYIKAPDTGDVGSTDLYRVTAFIYLTGQNNMEYFEYQQAMPKTWVGIMSCYNKMINTI